MRTSVKLIPQLKPSGVKASSGMYSMAAVPLAATATSAGASAQAGTTPTASSAAAAIRATFALREGAFALGEWFLPMPSLLPKMACTDGLHVRSFLGRWFRGRWVPHREPNGTCGALRRRARGGGFACVACSAGYPLRSGEVSTDSNALPTRIRPDCPKALSGSRKSVAAPLRPRRRGAVRQRCGNEAVLTL